MGLDNGIILCARKKIDKEKDIPNYLKDSIIFSSYDYEHNKKINYEVCYWRKCWGLRQEIINIIDLKSDEFEKEITLNNIDCITDVLKNYLDNPDDWNNSFWDFDEYMNHIARDIVALGWLKRYLIAHPNDYAIFYDSY